MAESAKNQIIFDDREFEFSEKDFNFIVDLVHKKTAIYIQSHKKNMIYSRIARRIRKLNLKTFAQYCDYLQSENGEAEITDFINAVTTNLTHFFRESHHFDHMKQVSLPYATGENFNKKRLRIWSAGCSKGMEAYSIAMVLRDFIKDIDQWDAKILATDIDTEVLKTGERGEYDAEDVESVPKEYLSKYVTIDKAKGIAHMSPQLKKLIHFKQLNFIDPWPVKGPFDIIFCRNVVIYFKKDTQKILFDQFADVLRPDGFLYIGHSESLHGVSDRFKLIGKTIYRKIK